MNYAQSLIVLTGLALALAGCSQSQDKGNSSEGLRSVSVPADFTFATSRSVSLQLSVSKSVLPEGTAASEVATPDGRVLFRGPLQADSPLNLQLAVPSKDSQLQVTLFVNNEPKKASVEIKDGKAVQSFQ